MATAQDGDVIGQQLQGQNREHRAEQPRAIWNIQHMVGFGGHRLVAIGSHRLEATGLEERGATHLLLIAG